MHLLCVIIATNLRECDAKKDGLQRWYSMERGGLIREKNTIPFDELLFGHILLYGHTVSLKD